MQNRGFITLMISPNLGLCLPHSLYSAENIALGKGSFREATGGDKGGFQIITFPTQKKRYFKLVSVHPNNSWALGHKLVSDG